MESEMNERVEKKLKDKEFRERLKRLMDQERSLLERLANEVPGEELAEPWGHKLTIHVYVEGDISRAADVSDFYASLAPEPEPDFVGIGISEVAERPVDQGGGHELTFPRYWTWEELQRFLIENDLVISEGMGEDDEMALTGKGEELFATLAIAKRLGGSAPE